MSTEKKVAIITGGASGIGFAFTRSLIEAGYAVVIADMAGADKAAATLKNEGFDVIGVEADVTSVDDTKKMVAAAVETFGGLDLLVNNAGIFTSLKLKPFDQIEPSEWMKVMEVNTLGPFLCAKAALPELRKSSAGRIINIASTSQMKGAPFMLHYTASKGAVISFTRSLARELGADNITVNAIAPGFTLSDGVLATGMEEVMGDVVRKTSRSIPRDQVPDDLTGALLFLASDGAAFITGQTIAVDGGSYFL
ncbi:MAG: glucose 1-dehydrogenase [Alphaproteobacteria bacterium]|nr:glucose 1-dehydrogenase [Alphaproteobacteria bacterium]